MALHLPENRFRAARRSAQRGFTLVEMMIAVAIVGILAALAVAGLDKMGAQEAPRDAALDFSAYLSKARSMAMERGADTWVIIYSKFKHKPSNALTGGNGAYFIYVDTDMDFGLGSCSSKPCWSNIDPTNLSTLYGGAGKLWDKVYLDDYKQGNARFSLAGDLSITPAPSIPSPLSITPASGCEFNGSALCGGTNFRAAIVFDGDGTARFVKDDGTVVSYASATTGGRSAVFGISGPATKQNYLFAVNGPTGFIGYYPQ